MKAAGALQLISRRLGSDGFAKQKVTGALHCRNRTRSLEVDWLVVDWLDKQRVGLQWLDGRSLDPVCLTLAFQTGTFTFQFIHLNVQTGALFFQLGDLEFDFDAKV